MSAITNKKSMAFARLVNKINRMTNNILMIFAFEKGSSNPAAFAEKECL